MDADWYVDPLGRYDGRFFDGESWTDQVSAGGNLAIDLDWTPEASDEQLAPPAASTIDDTVEPTESTSPITTVVISPDETSSDPTLVLAELDPPTPDSAALHADAAIEEVALPDPVEADTPAVTAVTVTRIEATTATESPARPVAVLDESVLAGRTPTTAPSKKSYRWLYLLGLLALLAAALAIVLPRLGSDSPTVGDPSSADADRVEDLVGGSQLGDEAAEPEPDTLEAPDVDLDVDAEANSGSDQDESAVDQPPGVAEPDADFDPADAVAVGDLVIANGGSVLKELTDWHEDFSADRGIALADDASCRFAQIASATAPGAYCGPFDDGSGTEVLYDVVPLRFVLNRDGLPIAQPVIGAVEVDQVLESGVELVGAGGAADEATSSRGDRNGG